MWRMGLLVLGMAIRMVIQIPRPPRPSPSIEQRRQGPCLIFVTHRSILEKCIETMARVEKPGRRLHLSRAVISVANTSSATKSAQCKTAEAYAAYGVC